MTFRPTKISANECDSGTNYLRQPSCHRITFLRRPVRNCTHPRLQLLSHIFALSFHFKHLSVRSISQPRPPRPNHSREQITIAVSSQDTPLSGQFHSLRHNFKDGVSLSRNYIYGSPRYAEGVRRINARSSRRFISSIRLHGFNQQ